VYERAPADGCGTARCAQRQGMEFSGGAGVRDARAWHRPPPSLVATPQSAPLVQSCWGHRDAVAASPHRTSGRPASPAAVQTAPAAACPKSRVAMCLVLSWHLRQGCRPNSGANWAHDYNCTLCKVARPASGQEAQDARDEDRCVTRLHRKILARPPVGAHAICATLPG